MRTAVLALLAAAAPACGGERDPFALPADTPVVLVIIDTLRADHLSCYGYELETSPVLDALSEQAYRFGANSTQCNSTFPSITSIMTGLYPKTHRNYVPVPLEETTVANREYASLAERLVRRGYRALAVVSHPVWTDEEVDSAVRRGWHAFSAIPADLTREERNELDHAGFVNQRAFALLDEYRRSHADSPLFLWVHYFDPHTEYDPPEEYRNLYLGHHLEDRGLAEYEDDLAPLTPDERKLWLATQVEPTVRSSLKLANGRALYDAEITYCDAEIGRLFDRLRELELFDRALVVVMADHGENMEDYGLGHGRINFSHLRLFEGVVATPLLVKLPGQTEGVTSEALTQNIDVLPTIMELLDLPAKPAVEGASLVPLLRDPAASVHERVYVEASNNVEKSIKTDDLKYIEPGDGEPPLVYRWRRDVKEGRDVAAEVEPGVLDQLAGWMSDFRVTDSLRLRLVPAAAPYRARIVLKLLDTEIEDVVGAPAGALSEDRRALRFEAEVGDEPVDLFLFLGKRESTVHWEVELGGAGAVTDRVYLGSVPLARTTALPAWVPVDGPAPEAPRVSAARDGAELAFDVDLAGADLAELELRFRERATGQRLTWLRGEGFEPVPFADGRLVAADDPTKLKLAARGGSGLGRATAHVRVDGELDDALFLVRFDGSWPASGTVRLDGRAVASGVVRFVFPAPPDGRLLSALLTEPDLGAAPPGSLLIWLESGGGPVEIDTSKLDPDLVDQLRALGYVR